MKRNNYNIIQLSPDGEEWQRFSCRSDVLTYLKSIGGIEQDCDYLSAISEDSVGMINCEEEILLFEHFMDQWQFGAAGVQVVLNEIADAAKNNSEYFGLVYKNW